MTIKNKTITLSFEDYSTFNRERDSKNMAKRYGLEQRESPVFDKVNETFNAAAFIRVTINADESTVTLEDCDFEERG